MIDTIFVGQTGLTSYAKGLRVISNNVTNLNTPGFKSSQLQFADLYYSSGGSSSGSFALGSGQQGYGVTTYSASLNFKDGELRQTGSDLDVAMKGNGLFVLQDESGKQFYSRAGQFEFNKDGVLVNKTDQAKVMALDANGNLVPITLTNLRINPAKQTANLHFSGNLSSTDTEHVLSNVKIIDRVGGEHLVTVTLRNLAPARPGVWEATVSEDGTTIGTGEITFVNGRPVSGSDKFTINYTPSGQDPMPVVLDFSTDTTAFAAGADSTLSLSSQDGYVAGGLTSVSFDESGKLKLVYSNGQTVKDKQLALARFDSLDAVQAEGSNRFVSTDDGAWHIGAAGNNGFGTVAAGLVEISNVDLSQEFSDLIIMQRGYQASSQIISTANEMIQELFDMKGRR